MSEAKLKATHPDGSELRYAHRRNMYWPGEDKPLGLAGYWIENDDELVHLGRKADWQKLEAHGFVAAEGRSRPGGSGVGFNKLKDENGRPLQVRRPVRNRITPIPGASKTDRLVYKRTIRNIVYVEGRASWMLEDIPVSFRAIGYCKFPGEVSTGMVALEVMGNKEVGWVRIDQHSVTYKGDDQ